MMEVFVKIVTLELKFPGYLIRGRVLINGRMENRKIVIYGKC